MTDLISPTLARNLNFLHPVLMWGLLGLSGYSMVLGLKAKKTRTASAEERKELIKGQFAKRHYLLSSLMLALMVLGTVGGMAVTYLNNGKLFVGPHLLVGLAMTALIAIAAALSPLMQQGNLVARKVHVGLNMTMMTLFLWQAVTGMQIVNKLLTSS
jgi:FtsH-binding integral membrane protein